MGWGWKPGAFPWSEAVARLGSNGKPLTLRQEVRQEASPALRQREVLELGPTCSRSDQALPYQKVQALVLSLGNGPQPGHGHPPVQEENLLPLPYPFQEEIHVVSGLDNGYGSHRAILAP